jgi:ribose transport system ATP-binding protein
MVDGHNRSLGLIAWRRVSRSARESLDMFGSTIEPGRLISELTATVRSVVSLARALTAVRTNVLGLLVLEETTAILPSRRSQFSSTRSGDCAMINVTHRLEEVRRLSDRVTVLRDGRHTPGVTSDELIEHIVGRPLSQVLMTRTYPIAGAAKKRQR